MKTMWITAAAIFVLDQASKWLVVQELELRTRGALDIWPPYLNLRMAWNEGINFGLLSSGESGWTRWVLIAVALAISAWVAWWMRRETRRAAQISAGLLIGGALGNVVDRLIYGAVADFLNMTCCGIDNPFAFNVADIAIFAGAGGLVLFTGERKTP